MPHKDPAQRKAYKAAWYQANREHALARDHQQYLEMKIERQSYQKSYRKANSLKLKEKDRLYHFRTRVYQIWKGMIKRCENESCKSFRFYGARGIKVCKEWRQNFNAFREWSLSHDYADDLTIDRIDSKEDYSPSNCRWITKSENSRRKGSAVA